MFKTTSPKAIVQKLKQLLYGQFNHVKNFILQSKTTFINKNLIKE